MTILESTAAQFDKATRAVMRRRVLREHDGECEALAYKAGAAGIEWRPLYR